AVVHAVGQEFQKHFAVTRTHQKIGNRISLGIESADVPRIAGIVFELKEITQWQSAASVENLPGHHVVVIALDIVFGKTCAALVGPPGHRTAKIVGEYRMRHLVRQNAGNKSIDRALDLHGLPYLAGREVE